MQAERPPDSVNRAAITVCVILATLMQALDTTIANVALPYMQGSVSASQDQIDWVLTSYIVAAAIMTPPTGFLAFLLGGSAAACGQRDSCGELLANSRGLPSDPAPRLFGQAQRGP